MSTMSLNISGCCNQLYTASSVAANWIVNNGKIVGAVVIEKGGKLANLAVDCLKTLGGYIGTAYAFSKDQMASGYIFAKGHVITAWNTARDFAGQNPRVIVAIGVALLAGALCHAVCVRASQRSSEAILKHVGTMPEIRDNVVVAEAPAPVATDTPAADATSS